MNADAGGVIDINADVGEGGAWDAALFADGITSANIACGGHAGDAATMAAACALAARHGVAAGAHPGYADRVNFGRAEQTAGRAELAELAGEQMRALRRQAEAAGTVPRHVKAHGALYHFLNRENEYARDFVAAARTCLPGAAVYGPPQGALREAAREAGVAYVTEGFIDRGYAADGTLIARGLPGALLEDEAQVAAQAVRLARGGAVRTLCLHGDGPEALRWLGVARRALEAAGFRIAAPGRPWAQEAGGWEPGGAPLHR